MKTKGQALVEVMIALAIAIVVIIGLAQVTVSALRNANFAKNQSLATSLAQQAIEKIRAYRDQHDWLTFTAGCGNKGAMGLADPPLPFTMLIGCTGGEDSQRTVTVTVSWSDAGGNHQTQLTTYLTNWQ
jgi:Tfp pilus assembly protein PilV